MSWAAPISRSGDCVDVRFLVGGWFMLEGGGSFDEGRVHLGVELQKSLQTLDQAVGSNHV